MLTGGTMAKPDSSVKFDFIRYSNCWEDGEALFRALEAKSGGRYLSIASAGDNSFNLLKAAPALVLAVDLNPAQLACCELRKAAFTRLSHPELLQFLGLREGRDRLAVYQELAGLLSPVSRQYWDHHLNLIAAGIVHAGKFERYFKYFRLLILPLIHSRREREELLAPKTPGAQREFYQNVWDSRRWRRLFKIFFSRFFLGHLGRDPEFFKYVNGDVSSRILKRTEYALSEIPAHTNPYLEYIVTGNFTQALPDYLLPGNFEAIRDNLDKLQFFAGSLREGLAAHPGIRFDGFNLSDIFEYMSFEDYQKELEALLPHAARGARLVYWNMLVERSRPESLKDRLNTLSRLAGQLFAEDRAFFYQNLIIEEVI